MIIYGTRSARIASTTLDSRTPEGALERMPIDVYSTYVHIFWIPLFPFQKFLGYKEGGKLMQVKRKKLPENLQQPAKDLLDAHRHPWWAFLGLLLVGVLILLVLVNG